MIKEYVWFLYTLFNTQFALMSSWSKVILLSGQGYKFANHDVLYTYDMLQSLIVIRKLSYYFSGGWMTISNDKYYSQHLRHGDS